MRRFVDKDSHSHEIPLNDSRFLLLPEKQMPVVHETHLPLNI
jgi:hypothetical protein